jgi:hypothetical protein
MKPEPGSWQHELVELLETLKRHEVPFLIAGGYAVAHSGHLRATKDLDIFVPRIAGSSARLARALSEFLMAEISEEDTDAQFLRFRASLGPRPGRGARSASSLESRSRFWVLMRSFATSGQ